MSDWIHILTVIITFEPNTTFAETTIWIHSEHLNFNEWKIARTLCNVFMATCNHSTGIPLMPYVLDILRNCKVISIAVYIREIFSPNLSTYVVYSFPSNDSIKIWISNTGTAIHNLKFDQERLIFNGMSLVLVCSPYESTVVFSMLNIITG